MTIHKRSHKSKYKSPPKRKSKSPKRKSKSPKRKSKLHKRKSKSPPKRKSKSPKRKSPKRKSKSPKRKSPKRKSKSNRSPKRKTKSKFKSKRKTKSTKSKSTKSKSKEKTKSSKSKSPKSKRKTKSSKSKSKSTKTKSKSKSRSKSKTKYSPENTGTSGSMSGSMSDISIGSFNLSDILSTNIELGLGNENTSETINTSDLFSKEESKEFKDIESENSSSNSNMSEVLYKIRNKEMQDKIQKMKRERKDSVIRMFKQDFKFSENTFKPMLAKKFTKEDPKNYWMSEKLDGCRALFYNKDGGKFLSRTNKSFNGPEKYLRDIANSLPPGIVLDGELYIGKKMFAETVSAIRKKVPIESEWERVTFKVFDLPLINKPFNERYAMLECLLVNVPNVELLKHYPVESEEQFLKFHTDIVEQGGEGTMLRNPNSYYANTRSKELLKVKDYFDDEVIVEGMEYGNGRNSNVMGNIVVRWAQHSKMKYTGLFNVGGGFTDYHRKNWKTLFPKGTLITIKYMVLQPSGKPREPIFIKVYDNL